MVEPQLGQRGVERAPRLVGQVVAVVELGGDEQLVARDAAGRDRAADALLVAVHLRGVEVPVAHLERLLDHLAGSPRGHLEDAEAELGDGGAVVELDSGTVMQGMTSSVPRVFRPAYPRRRDQASSTRWGRASCRSKGSRQANGAISWWIWLGPQDPGL